MAEQWFIRVQGKEYGPADMPTLQDWKSESRVLRTNEARRSDQSIWTTAAEIPGLFEFEEAVPSVPPVQHEQVEPVQPVDHADPAERVEERPRRSLREIFYQTLSIYRRGFFQFFGLTLLIIGPSICAQLTEGFIISGNSVTDVDLGQAAAALFTVCMGTLTLILWPVYIAGIQILSAELSEGNRAGFLSVLNAAFRYWPRVAGLCIVVYGVFFLLTVFALGIAVMIEYGGGSLASIFLSLVFLTLQVGLFGRWFINTLFWQQTAVLENANGLEAYQLSKQVARSRRDLPWYRRPLWRGVFIASIWFAFEIALKTAAVWPVIQQLVPTIMNAQTPQAMMEAMRAAELAHKVDAGAIALWVAQWIVRPLLGIAFVVLYFDSRIEPNDESPA